MLDAIEAVIGTSAKFMLFTGAPPSNCRAAVTGTKITEFDLAASRSQRSSTRGRAKKCENRCGLSYRLWLSRYAAIFIAGLIAAEDGFDTAKNRLKSGTFLGPSNRRGLATAGKIVFKRRSMNASIVSTLTARFAFLSIPKKPVGCGAR
jgi:hypothetical protein